MTTSKESSDKYQFVYQEFDLIREYQNSPTSFDKPEKIISTTKEVSFPIRMQEARIRKRITVGDLAELCGIDIKEIINYENSVEVPSVTNMEIIQKVLEM